jgi:hypothetical protein
LEGRGFVLLGAGGAPAGHVSNPALLEEQLHAPGSALWEACREARLSSEVCAGTEATAAVLPIPGAQLVWEIGGKLAVLSLAPWLLFYFLKLNERAFECRCTNSSIQHPSSSLRRSARCSPTSCTSKGSSKRMRRRLVRLCGATMMCLTHGRLALSSAHRSPR